MQGSKQARAGNTRQAQAILKNFSRKTKAMGNDNWTANRVDFTAQTSEAYGAMSMQVRGSRMPEPEQRGTTQHRNKLQKRSTGGNQMDAMSNQGQSVRMDDRMASQLF